MKRLHVPMSAMFTYSVLLVLLASFGHAQVNVLRTTDKLQTAGASSRRPARKLPPIAPQSLYSPLAVLDDPANARLVLNNTSLQNIDVRYTVYSREGEILALNNLIVPASEVRFVMLSELLKSSGEGHRRDLGGIQLDYLGRPLGLLSQMTFLRGPERSSIDGVFPGDVDVPSATQMATWSMPASSEATLVLGNAAGVNIAAKLTIDSRRPQEITLPAHATRLVHVREESSGERGSMRAHHASVTYDGPKSALRETGFVIAESGYGTPIRFYDRGAARQADLFATDLPANDALLAMTLFNSSGVEVVAHPELLPIGGDHPGTIDSAPVKIGPGQAVLIDFEQASASLQNSKADSVSVHVASSGGPGDLIGSLVSVRKPNSRDEHGVSPAPRDLIAEVPIHDPGSPGHSTGSYPLRFDGDYTNIVTITNVSIEEKKFFAFIALPAAKYIFRPQVLKPGETARFDVNAIKTKQEKDAFGHALPLDLKVAKFVWSIGAPYGSARMIGRNHMVSVRNGVSASFSCGVCCPGGSRGPFPIPEPGGIMGLGSFASGSVTFESTNDCQGDFTSFPSTLSEFGAVSFDNPNVCTQTDTDGGYQMHAIGVGSANMTYTIQFLDIEFDSQDCFQNGPFQQPATDNVVVYQLQYQSDSGFVDATTATIYVLAGTTVNFKVVPSGGQPQWSGSSGASGSSDTISVAFNQKSSNSTDFKTVVAMIGGTVTLTANVLVYDITPVLTPQDNFTGRSLTRFGVGEVVSLSFTASPSIMANQAGGLLWQLQSGTGTLTNQTNSGTATFTAPFAAETDTLALKVQAGPSKNNGKTNTLSIIAPSGQTQIRDSTTGILHTQGFWECGMKTSSYVQPSDVSFAKISDREGMTTAIATGFISPFNGQIHPVGATVNIGSCDIHLGCKELSTDTDYTGRLGPPFSAGTFDWNIPQQWKPLGASDAQFANYTTLNHHETADAMGTAVISKGGESHTCLSTDPTTTY